MPRASGQRLIINPHNVFHNINACCTHSNATALTKEEFQMKQSFDKQPLSVN